MVIDIQIEDHLGARRRFRASTAQSAARIKPFICLLPLKLEPAWNCVRLDLGALVARVYGTRFAVCVRVLVSASCRIRRIEFAGGGGGGRGGSGGSGDA